MAFDMPNNLPELSVEDLTSKINEARTEFNELNDSDDISDETLERMEELANSIEDLQVEKGQRRREELSARVGEEPVAEVVAPVEEVAAAVATVVEPEVEVEAAVVETQVEAPVEDTQVVTEEEVVVEAASEEDETVVPVESIPETKESTLVAASNITPADVAVPENNRPSVLIAAAQDVPQFYVGQRLDPSLLADAIHNKSRMLSDSRGAMTVYPVATIERPFGEGYDLEGLDQAATWDKLDEMTKTTALTASGGWCAPSETVYDLFEVECDSDNLFSLPTFRVTRGGIRWPVFAPHDESFNPGFVWTEANDIAATGGTPTKPCVRISCPTFTEARLDATGLCITAGNLMDRAYPEQIKWYVNRAVRAYERNNAARKLNLVLADTVPVSVPASFGAASAVVSALLLQSSDYRQQNGLCAGETLDVVAPYWVKDLIKADVARQQGTFTGEGSLPSDAAVDQWFQAASLNLRYIDHWQYFTHPATTWPTSVQFLIGYPGSYIEFNQGRLDLGVIRDSVLNSTNDFTAMWFEEFFTVGRRGPQHRLITLPVCANGEIGARVAPHGVSTCPIG